MHLDDALQAGSPIRLVELGMQSAAFERAALRDQRLGMARGIDGDDPELVGQALERAGARKAAVVV